MLYPTLGISLPFVFIFVCVCVCPSACLCIVFVFVFVFFVCDCGLFLCLCLCFVFVFCVCVCGLFLCSCFVFVFVFVFCVCAWVFCFLCFLDLGSLYLMLKGSDLCPSQEEFFFITSILFLVQSKMKKFNRVCSRSKRFKIKFKMSRLGLYFNFLRW